MGTKLLKIEQASVVQLSFHMLRVGFLLALICVVSLTVIQEIYNTINIILQEYNYTINLVVFNNIDKYLSNKLWVLGVPIFNVILMLIHMAVGDLGIGSKDVKYINF